VTYALNQQCLFIHSLNFLWQNKYVLLNAYVKMYIRANMFIDMRDFGK